MLRLRERVVGITETERASLPLYEMAVLRTSDVESGAELVNTTRHRKCCEDLGAILLGGPGTSDER
jgi:hypothetical protein